MHYWLMIIECIISFVRALVDRHHPDQLKRGKNKLKAVCHAFDWVIMTIQRIGNLNG